MFTRSTVAVGGVGDNAEHHAQQLQCGRVVEEVGAPELIGQDVLAELEEAQLNDVDGEGRSRAIFDAALNEADVGDARLVLGVQRTTAVES